MSVTEAGNPTQRVTIDPRVLRSMCDELVRVEDRLPERPQAPAEGRRTMFRGIQR